MTWLTNNWKVNRQGRARALPCRYPPRSGHRHNRRRHNSHPAMATCHSSPCNGNRCFPVTTAATPGPCKANPAPMVNRVTNSGGRNRLRARKHSMTIRRWARVFGRWNQTRSSRYHHRCQHRRPYRATTRWRHTIARRAAASERPLIPTVAVMVVPIRVITDPMPMEHPAIFIYRAGAVCPVPAGPADGDRRLYEHI